LGDDKELRENRGLAGDSCSTTPDGGLVLSDPAKSATDPRTHVAAGPETL
jgi:hypothetical protein